MKCVQKLRMGIDRMQMRRRECHMNREQHWCVHIYMHRHSTFGIYDDVLCYNIFWFSKVFKADVTLREGKMREAF